MLRVAVIRNEGEVECVVGLYQDLSAYAPIVIAVQVPPVGDVLDVTLLGLCEGGQPAEDSLGNRACDSTAERIFLVFGDQGVEFAAQGSCRGLGGDRDNTGRRVLPEQGALRPA